MKLIKTLFQHTAARRRLHGALDRCVPAGRFNTQPPEGGCPLRKMTAHSLRSFNTQPPEGGCGSGAAAGRRCKVSTHSRPKAAAGRMTTHQRARAFQHTAARRRLLNMVIKVHMSMLFQHTAARRRLLARARGTGAGQRVSTHSRPKAAAGGQQARGGHLLVSTHSRPKAAATMREWEEMISTVSTHSRPKAAAAVLNCFAAPTAQFQHTAARRRLRRCASGKK